MLRTQVLKEQAGQVYFDGARLHWAQTIDEDVDGAEKELEGSLGIILGCGS